MSRAAGPEATLWSKLARGGSPILAILYDDLDGRRALLDEVRGQLESMGGAVQVDGVDDACAHPDAVAIWSVPYAQQVSAVEQLEAQRDRLRGRRRPLVLVLPRGGAAIDRLRRSPFLASWLAGRIIDPDALARIDPARERRAFEAHTGRTPEAFLDAWRRGALPDDLDHNLWVHRARFLAEPGG